MKRAMAIVVMWMMGAALGMAQQVIKEEVDGIRNLARIETTVACSGAITPESVVRIKAMGFASLINLRLASESGANVELEAEAAKAAGLKYEHLPFETAKPDPAIVDRLLAVLGTPGHQPAFIHCAGGVRASMMWLIKRVMLDNWTTDQAMEEAVQLGLTSEPLKKFAMEYIESHKK